jgi:hypothetical protein
MKLKLYEALYQVVKLSPDSDIPASALQGDFYSVTRTDEELSVVCRQRINIPCESRESGWRIIKIIGVLDFSLIGILSRISTVLADNNVSIFAVSTFNTDYILIKNKDADTAVMALKEAGYEVYVEESI